MANLPADLPTNWTQGQIISPNGTEVGLSQKHGYNYLNQQVNTAQSEVNTINGALADLQGEVGTLSSSLASVADEIEAINTEIQSGAKRAAFTAVLSTNWNGSSAPFTQVVTVSGILASDTPHIAPVFSADNEMAILELEAWAMVNKAVTNSGSITFTCFEEKTTTAINLQIEVIR